MRQGSGKSAHTLLSLGFNVFSFLSLCKTKRPLVGPILSGFDLYAQSLKTMSKGCCISNIRVFGMPVHEKKIFQNSPNVTPFPPLLDSNRGQPLDFCKRESPFFPISQGCCMSNIRVFGMPVHEKSF